MSLAKEVFHVKQTRLYKNPDGTFRVLYTSSDGAVTKVLDNKAKKRDVKAVVRAELDKEWVQPPLPGPF